MGLWEVKASRVYLVISRLSSVTQGEPVSKPEQANKKQTIKSMKE